MGFPHGHRKTTTLVAGLRMTGMVAPMVLDGPINGDWFEAYVAQVLVPELRHGDVVIMDNLSSHIRHQHQDIGRSEKMKRHASYQLAVADLLFSLPGLDFRHDVLDRNERDFGADSKRNDLTCNACPPATTARRILCGDYAPCASPTGSRV